MNSFEMNDFLIPLVTVLLAEWGDNSFLLLAYIATKTKRHALVFWAAITAYVSMNALTAFLGNAVTEWLKPEILKPIVGGIFIVLGLSAFFMKEKGNWDDGVKTHHLFRSVFILILLAEVVDRSNIAVGLFSTHYNPALVVLGVTVAHLCITGLAIRTGKWIGGKFNHAIIAKIGATLFIIIGLIIILAT